MADDPNVITDDAGNIIQLASNVSLVRCDCGSFNLRLHGPSGRIFAIAAMPARTALAIADEVLLLIDAKEFSEITDDNGSTSH